MKAWISGAFLRWGRFWEVGVDVLGGAVAVADAVGSIAGDVGDVGAGSGADAVAGGVRCS